MRVLISGGAGFIGSHLCERALRAGHEVLAIDSLITGNRANIAHLVDNPAFRFIQHDVTCPFPFAGPLDILFHFASPASPVDYLRLPIETLKGQLPRHP